MTLIYMIKLLFLFLSFPSASFSSCSTCRSIEAVDASPLSAANSSALLEAAVSKGVLSGVKIVLPSGG